LYYNKALAIDPRDVDALNNKGVALAKRKIVFVSILKMQ